MNDSKNWTLKSNISITLGESLPLESVAATLNTTDRLSTTLQLQNTAIDFPHLTKILDCLTGDAEKKTV